MTTNCNKNALTNSTSRVVPGAKDSPSGSQKNVMESASATTPISLAVSPCSGHAGLGLGYSRISTFICQRWLMTMDDRSLISRLSKIKPHYSYLRVLRILLTKNCSFNPKKSGSSKQLPASDPDAHRSTRAALLPSAILVPVKKLC